MTTVFHTTRSQNLWEDSRVSYMFNSELPTTTTKVDFSHFYQNVEEHFEFLDILILLIFT